MAQLRVAFDLDGVLADFASALRNIEVRLFTSASPEPGADPAQSPPQDDTSAAALRGRRQARLWQDVVSTPDFWTTLDPLDSTAVPRIHELAGRHGWDVFFVTQRPSTAGDSVQRQTQRWLVAQGFALPSVIVHRRSRGTVAAGLELDFLVDDSPKNCVDVVSESEARALLLGRSGRDDSPSHENARRLGIRTLPSVAACLSVLEDATDRRARPSLLTKVKNALSG